MKYLFSPLSSSVLEPHLENAAKFEFSLCPLSCKQKPTLKFVTFRFPLSYSRSFVAIAFILSELRRGDTLCPLPQGSGFVVKTVHSTR